jgi:parallel beta-helix repeat protein
VTGVTLRNLDISGSGSVGIYLEAGSKGTLVERNHVHDNGYGDVTPEGIPFVVGGVEIRYLSTGREGIAIDGSRDNVVRRNVIERNSYGGIFLYKNCGEYFTQQPGQWWTRRYGADGNRIEKNRISDEYTGVWIGSRMAENTLFMDCSDAPYSTGPLSSIRLDYAKQNVVDRNVFTDVAYGIRVEDDGNAITSNRFRGSDSTDQAVLVGTLYRTSVLARPVSGTTIARNVSSIRDNLAPFGWIHGHTGTTFERNRARGRLATLVPGVQPTINFHLFVKQILPGS